MTKISALSPDQLAVVFGGQASPFDDAGGPFANRTISVPGIINTFGTVPGTFSPGALQSASSPAPTAAPRPSSGFEE
jgi:hypothetical protein